MELNNRQVKGRALVRCVLVASLSVSIVLLIGLPQLILEESIDDTSGGGGSAPIAYVPLYTSSLTFTAESGTIDLQSQVTSTPLHAQALMGRYVQVNLPDARVQNSLIDFNNCSKNFEKQTKLFCQLCTGTLTRDNTSLGFASRGSCMNMQDGTTFSQFNLNLRSGSQIIAGGNSSSPGVVTGALLAETGGDAVVRRVDNGEPPPIGVAGAAAEDSPTFSGATTCSSTGKTVIDLMLAYTPEARCRAALRAGSVAGADTVPATDPKCSPTGTVDNSVGKDPGPINAKISTWLAETNQAFCNSNINIWIRPVAVVETKDNEQGAASTELPLSNLRSSLLQTAGGKFPELKVLRGLVGADLVTVIADVVDTMDTSCELAPTIPAGTTLTDPDDNSGNYAFISAKPACDGPTKKFALARAIGHLMGQGAAATDPDNTLYPGISPNAHGYRSLGGCWGTIMSSPTNSSCTSAQVLPFFSTQSLGAGATCSASIGGAGFDSRTSLNSVATVIAGYRAEKYRNTYYVFDRDAFAPYVAGGDPFPEGAYFQIGHAIRHSICGIAPDPTRAINNVADFAACGDRQTAFKRGTLKLPTVDDLVLVGPGLYRERNGIVYSSLTLQSMAGAANTVISGKFDRAYLTAHGMGSYPDGWTYTNHFQGNSGVLGISGVLSVDFDRRDATYPNPEQYPQILSTANFTGQNILPGGQTDKFASPTVDGFTITGGFGDRGAGGIWVGPNVNVKIINNIITNNTSYSGFGAGLTIGGSAGTISNNIFFNNRIEQVEACLLEGRPTSPPYSMDPVNCDPTSTDPAVRYNIRYLNCYWGRDFRDPVWWPTVQAYYPSAVPPRVQVTSPGKYFCHQIPKAHMQVFEPADNYEYYRQQYDQADTTRETDDRVGGAAIYVSNVCRTNPLLAVAGDLRSIEGYALCNAESVTGTLEISKNLIYGNTYKNGGTSALLVNAGTRSKLGGAVFIDNPLNNVAIRGLPGTPISTVNHLNVKLISNTVVGNKILDTAAISGLAGAGIGCATGAPSVDLENSLITGNAANSITPLLDNFRCDDSTNSGTANVTIEGDPNLPLTGNFGVANPASYAVVFQVNPVTILNATPSPTTGVNDMRIQPANLNDPAFPLRLSDGGPTTGQCICMGTVPMRMHAAVDRSPCSADEVDILGTSRCSYTPANDAKVCSISPCIGAAITSYRDRGALEKTKSTVLDSTCAAHNCGGDSIITKGRGTNVRVE